MGNSLSGGSSTEQAQCEKYRADLEEWEKTVAAQEAHEATLAWRERPLACDKLLYVTGYVTGYVTSYVTSYGYVIVNSWRARHHLSTPVLEG